MYDAYIGTRVLVIVDDGNNNGYVNFFFKRNVSKENKSTQANVSTVSYSALN